MSPVAGQAYGFGVTVPGAFEEVVQRVREAFKAEGFGQVSELDVRKTLQEKIGKEIESYTVMGMCNPGLASRAIAAEHEIGLLLPCNVLVHECGGSVRVVAQDPLLMMAMVGNDALEPIAREALEGVQRAMGRLGA